MATGKNYYPLLILLLIGGFLCFSTWAALRTAASRPQVTDADYYSKGLRYTSTLLEKQAAVALGWTVSSGMADRTLHFYLSDRQGQPVSAARGTLHLYLPDQAAEVSLPLRETTAGTYQLQLLSNMTGSMHARLEFERDGVRLNRQLLLNL